MRRRNPKKEEIEEEEEEEDGSRDQKTERERSWQGKGHRLCADR